MIACVALSVPPPNFGAVPSGFLRGDASFEGSFIWRTPCVRKPVSIVVRFHPHSHMESRSHGLRLPTQLIRKKTSLPYVGFYVFVLLRAEDRESSRKINVIKSSMKRVLIQGWRVNSLEFLLTGGLPSKVCSDVLIIKSLQNEVFSVGTHSVLGSASQGGPRTCFQFKCQFHPGAYRQASVTCASGMLTCIP